MSNTLTGTSLSGNIVDEKRVINDYYATPPESTLKLLILKILKEIYLNHAVVKGIYLKC